MSSADPIVDEIEKYLKSDVNCNDFLQFWQLSGDEYPHLKSLARLVLAIPATSTPSERVFSTTGLIFNAKRTMLLPENIEKIQVIHDNYNLLKKRNDFVFVCTFVLYIFLVINILMVILFLLYHDRDFIYVCCKY